MADPRLTTGSPGLDSVLKSIMPGDNLVWQVDAVADYAPFVEPCCRAAIASGKKVVYFRFARHEPLLTAEDGVEVVPLDPEAGFEQFVRRIHVAVDETRSRGVYIFDCLSDLVADWYSDRMLGNFFRLICPYVYDVEGLAYFSMLRNYHSLSCHAAISGTTQILIDVYRHSGELYIHPLKVQQRHSPTMYLLHVWSGDKCRPVLNSATISEILTAHPPSASRSARSRLGVWNRTFLQAEELCEKRREGTAYSASTLATLKRRLLRMAISRDEHMLGLVEAYFDLEDVLTVWHRMVGSGLIGGKAVGMLVARAILQKKSPRWKQILEPHDSFHIASDVFYDYLVQNGCWWLRERQRDSEHFLEGAEVARQRILAGTFPPDAQNDFADILDYFGQCPIIVRSSSLLEDAFGNSFAGKYESVFCVNQGSRDKRLEDFMSAVRSIYASTMSERALRYRAQRGLLDRDEQMSLLVQRVSGSLYGSLFYPQVAGVALSFNPYAWNERIDPDAGVLRMVFGLGTHAVDRRDDDYTRVVALNAPELRPEAGIDQVRRYAQHKVDVLDVNANQLVSRDFIDVAAESPSLEIDRFASRDDELSRQLAESPLHGMAAYTLTFDSLLSETRFVGDMHDMLKTLQDAYGCPVDTEFTMNYFDNDTYRINLVQCRPLPVAGAATITPLDASGDEKNIILRAHGAVVGPSRECRLDRLIYVVPANYGKLPVNDRWAIARLIGRLMHSDAAPRPEHVMLLGPGRWGTTMPSLGVPVSFTEINLASVLCEIVAMHEDLVPDVSLGTHFFNELVEADMLYLALFPGHEGNVLNEALLEALPNRLEQVLPSAAGRGEIVHVIDADDLPAHSAFMLHADNRQQTVVCYLKEQACPETT
ncbi:MAG: PEP/pyruvate-binding domain-containing protein [Phycisphaerae bacterium]|nr:PEP/pyruvate-binding domain-containing protein [Phycisphaerae bacterium]